MSKNIFLSLIIGFFLITPFHFSKAATSAWAHSDHVRARLLSSAESLGLENVFDGAVEIILSEGWHTYWKMPGDSGLPPRFDWSKSSNVETAEVLWPAPTRKTEMDFQVFSYSNAVMLPLLIKRKDHTQPAALDLQLSIMVCDEICIPQQLSLTLEIPKNSEEQGIFSHETQKIIDFAKRKVPLQNDDSILKIESAVMGPEALVLNVVSKNPIGSLDAVAYTDEIFFTEPPKITPDSKDQKRAMITLKKPAEIKTEDITGKMLHLFVTDGRTSTEHKTQF